MNFEELEKKVGELSTKLGEVSARADKAEKAAEGLSTELNKSRKELKSLRVRLDEEMSEGAGEEKDSLDDEDKKEGSEDSVKYEEMSEAQFEELSAEEKGKCFAAMKAKFDKSKSDVKMAERKSKFDSMLAEGKVCEAQREPYLKNDMVKFAETAAPVSTKAKGNGKTPAAGSTNAMDQITKLAEEKVSKEKITLAEAQGKVMLENPELRKQYEREANAFIKE